MSRWLQNGNYSTIGTTESQKSTQCSGSTSTSVETRLPVPPWAAQLLSSVTTPRSSSSMPNPPSANSESSTLLASKSLRLSRNTLVAALLAWRGLTIKLSSALFKMAPFLDFKNPNPCKLADPNLDEYPLCVAVFEPQYTMSGNVEVLLWVNDLVLLVKEDGVQQLGVGVGPLQKLVVSQNGKLLASFTHDGRLLVISTDFSKIIFEYSSESALPPDQLAWCGMDSVLLYWDDMLLMVGYMMNR